jgi:membrane-associated protease RseP (regulator of RpoE activity)
VGALAATFVSYGLAMGLSFAIFVVARQLAAAACGARGGLPPFGEPPSDAFAGARRGARLAVTAAGPLALFVVGSLLLAVATFIGGTGRPGTRIVNAVDGMPAARAGLREGDRIVALDGQRVSDPQEIHPLLEHIAGASVAVTVRRDGVEITLPVGIDPRQKKIGVAFGADPPTAADAFSGALLFWPRTIEALASKPGLELAGPIAVARVAEGAPSKVFLAAATMIVLGILPLFVLASLLLLPVAAVAKKPAATPPVPGVRRPWTRLAARLIDYTLIWIAVVAAFGFDLEVSGGLVGFLVVILFVPVEALFLAFGGATPGKWLLGLAVVDAAGRRPRLRVAFRRAALVWTYGLAAGLPLGLATTVLAHRRVATTGSAYWDDLEGLTEALQVVPWWRRGLAAAVLAAFASLQVLQAWTVLR